MTIHAGDAMRVLAVEDSPDLRDLLTMQLTYGGYDVVCADNGVDALKLAILTDPQIVLTDVLMPLLSGTDLVRQLRAMPRFERTPVILYTGMSADDNQDIRDALNLPLVRCVQKGAPLKEMLSALARVRDL